MSYYVTAHKNGDRRKGVAYLAGPFRTHGEALAVEPRARRMASNLDPIHGPWASYGTAHDRKDHARVGLLNSRLGLVGTDGGYVGAQ